MKQFKVVEGAWTVPETTRVFGLKIKEGASLSAPEGKYLTVTLNGVGIVPVPGTYEGDVVLTVTDEIPVTSYKFRAGACIDGGKYVPEKSVPDAIGGKIRDGRAEDVSFTNRDVSFNGFYIGGEGEYVIDGFKADVEGNGENDFIGYGAAICCGGSSKLTVNNADIKVRGAARNAIFAGDNSTLTVNNSKIQNYTAVLPADYEDNVAPGRMWMVPWMLGLRGNNRATNLEGHAVAYYNNCELRSDGWGVMSTDGVRVCRLNIKDSIVELNGASGYGAFSIGDCVDTFDGCTINVPDYALIVANETASGVFKGGTTVNSKRFGVMFFKNQGGTVEVCENSAFNTEKATFLVRGCAPCISVKDARLQPKNGVILQLMNCDDPGNPAGHYCDPVGEDVKDPEHDFARAEKGVDVLASFENVTLNGSFFNGMTDAEGDTGPKMQMGPPPGGMPGGPGGMPGGPGGMPGGPGGPGGMQPEVKGAKNLVLSFKNSSITGLVTAAKSLHRVEKITKVNCEEMGEVDNTPAPAINNGVSLSLDGSVWNVTGDCYLTGLKLSEGSSIKGEGGKTVVITVDGKTVPAAPGEYTGSISVKLQ